MSFGKIYTGFTTGMGIYGFSRGYRARDNEMVSDKLVSGTFNTLLYVTPVVNIWPLVRLTDRITIQSKGLDKNKYRDAYFELTGICWQTI